MLDEKRDVEVRHQALSEAGALSSTTISRPALAFHPPIFENAEKGEAGREASEHSSRALACGRCTMCRSIGAGGAPCPVSSGRLALVGGAAYGCAGSRLSSSILSGT